LGVVEDLVVSATEEVRHTVVIDYVVNRATYASPDAERSRVARINAVTTAIPVVPVTWITRTGVSKLS